MRQFSRAVLKIFLMAPGFFINVFNANLCSSQSTIENMASKKDDDPAAICGATGSTSGTPETSLRGRLQNMTLEKEQVDSVVMTYK